MKHLRFFFTAASGLDLFAVTEPALEVPSSSRGSWKGPALKYPLWTVQLAPGEHPPVSQQLRLVKSQPQLLSCYAQWKDRWIQLVEQHPRLGTSRGPPCDQLLYHFCNIQTLRWSKERALFSPFEIPVVIFTVSNHTYRWSLQYFHILPKFSHLFFSTPEQRFRGWFSLCMLA